MAFVTAGFPTVEESIDIILGLEAGGAGMYHLNSMKHVLTFSFASHRCN